MAQQKQLTAKERKVLAARHHLLSAANRLVANMGTPTAFLLFCTDAINWMTNYMIEMKKFDREDDHHYTAIVMIENIIPAWFAGGPDVVERIADGIKGVYQYCGNEGVRLMINSIIVGHGKYSEGIDWTSGWIMEHSAHMGALGEFLASLEQYDLEIRAEELLKAA